MARRWKKSNYDLMREQVDPMVIALDTNGNILTINGTGERLTGYSAAEITGKNWVDTFIPPVDRPEIRELLQDVIEGDLSIGNENPIVTRDGRQLLIRWMNFRLMDGNCGYFNPDGDVVCLASVGYDVTGDDEDDSSQV